MLSVLRSPVLHIVLVVSLTLALTFAAAVGLTLAKFDRALTDAVDARYRIHADDIRSGIETGINLGLGLEEIRTNVEALITDRVAVDEGIIGIRITDQSGGEVLSVAGTATLGSDARSDRQSLEIENSFGQVVGEVNVAYATGGNRDVLLATGRTLAANAAILAGLAAAATSICCLMVMAPIPRNLGQALAALSGHGVSADDKGRPTESVVAEAVEAASRTHQVMDELVALSATLPENRKSRAA